jgi:hypothetical protein
MTKTDKLAVCTATLTTLAGYGLLVALLPL